MLKRRINIKSKGRLRFSHASKLAPEPDQPLDLWRLGLARASVAIAQAKRNHKHEALDLPFIDEVVAELRRQGYRVTYHPVRCIGDIATHQIKWD